MLTKGEYLQIERKAEYKSEYCDGVIRPMARSNSTHCLIVGDITYLLASRTRTHPCYVLCCNMRIRVSDRAVHLC